MNELLASSHLQNLSWKTVCEGSAVFSRSQLQCCSFSACMLNMSICNWTQNEPEQTQLEISHLETEQLQKEILEAFTV